MNCLIFLLSLIICNKKAVDMSISKCILRTVVYFFMTGLVCMFHLRNTWVVNLKIGKFIEYVIFKFFANLLCKEIMLAGESSFCFVRFCF